jgi:hypothetical protein
VIDVNGLVAVAGFCIIAGLAGRDLILLPALLAIVDTLSPVRGAFVGAMVVVLLSGIHHIGKVR